MYIATQRYDTGGGPIFGLGETRREAVESAKDYRGPGDPAAVELFTWPATPELVALIFSDGRTGLPWALRGDIADIQAGSRACAGGEATE